ncbi:MAG TPA: GNAT family N-acetyltransferase [Steroidobacteraceae bacterium]
MTDSEVSSVMVRGVRPADVQAWRVLWDGYNAFYGRQGDTALPEEITRMTWLRFFDAYEPLHALVAIASGKLVGLAHYVFHRSTIQIAPTCYLSDLYTDPEVRGQGVGAALIEAVYAAAAAHGVPRVYWQTHETNRTAMQLYDKVADKSGFVVYRRSIP